MIAVLAGGLLLVAAGALCDQWAAAELCEHHQRLLEVEQGLLSLKREIAYAARPLEQALRAAITSAGGCADLFELAAAGLAQGCGRSGEEAWTQAVRQTAARRPFTLRWNREEINALLCVGSGLGESDIAGQLRQLDMARERLADCITKAAERAEKYGRIYRTLGWSGGVLLCLLLL